MAITIKVIGSYLVAECESFDQSKWIGGEGFWFYGHKSRKVIPCLPLNTRYLPVEKADTVAHLVGVENVEWTPEAMGIIAPKAANLQESRSADSDMEIPAPQGLTYRPYQRAGVAFALRQLQVRKGVIIGDEMGLGKTMQAIGVMAVTNPTNVLIVCPASLVTNWQREIHKWLPERPLAHIVRSGEEIPAEAHTVIVNYDKVVGRKTNAVNLRKQLSGRTWNLLVCDEAHMLKNPAAQRTKYFFGSYKRDTLTSEGLVHKADRVLLLTGTPIQNKVRESATLLRACGAFGAGQPFGKEGDFLFRHCGAQKEHVGYKTFWTFDGATNLPELQSKLRAGGVMIRRLKKDVATELPPKLRSVITLPYEYDIDPEFGCERFPQMNTELDFGSLHTLIGEKLTFEQISAMRSELAKFKQDAVISHVRETLESTDKVLIFAHHKTLVSALCEAFSGECIRIDGETPVSDRQALVDRFQADHSVKVAVLSTHAAGVGLTLTAANVVIFAEADWNPAWCVQAEDRAHRIGQEAESVTVQYLVLDKTLDAHVVRTMVAKMDIADAALDRVKETTAAPAAPPPAPKKENKTAEITVKGQTYTITPDVKAATCEALTYLSSQCDGARTDDARGFNGLDAHSEFVQSLVATARNRGTLSDKQCAWALKILRTYSKTQISHLTERLYMPHERY